MKIYLISLVSDEDGGRNYWGLRVGSSGIIFCQRGRWIKKTKRLVRYIFENVESWVELFVDKDRIDKTIEVELTDPKLIDMITSKQKELEFLDGLNNRAST